jgi:hypothetical protein
MARPSKGVKRERLAHMGDHFAAELWTEKATKIKALNLVRLA